MPHDKTNYENYLEQRAAMAAPTVPAHRGPYASRSEVPELPEGWGVEEHGSGPGWIGEPGLYIKRLPKVLPAGQQYAQPKAPTAEQLFPLCSRCGRHHDGGPINSGDPAYCAGGVAGVVGLP